MDELELIAVSIGNTRTRMGLFRGRSLDAGPALPSADPAAVAAAVMDIHAGSPGSPVVIASVRPDVSTQMLDELRAVLPHGAGTLYLFGRDLPIPMPTAVEDASAVGHDRLLNALGAYSRAQQACIVVDAGTAVTVDFVDGEGTFQGGAIAPGLNMMLSALHQQTAALPALRFESIGDEHTFGKDTKQAMCLGAQAAVRGMVRHLTERYSERYGAYPQIVATGGDARALFENDDLIEMIVPDLTLIGIQAACAVQLTGEDADDA